MLQNNAINALYRQYEEEISRLELYGHVSSLTYEEWLEIKKQHKENSLNHVLTRWKGMKLEKLLTKNSNNYGR